MTAMIDTLETAQKLKDAGMPEPQAHEVARAISAGLSDERIATKSDLERLKFELTNRMLVIVGSMLAIFTALDKIFLT